MSNETKAEVRGMFPEGNPNYITYPASTAVKLARYEKELGSKLEIVLYLCIPVAEAREFLGEVLKLTALVPGVIPPPLEERARAFLATLPEEGDAPPPQS